MSNLAEDVISTVSIESKDSTSTRSIPTSITVNMSSSEQTNDSKKRKASAISLGDGTSRGNEEETELQALTSLVKTMSETMNRRFEEMSNTMNSRFEEVLKKIEGRFNPHDDDFFDIKLVEQSASILKRTSTWTLMQITDKDGLKCIGVSSAHLINSNLRAVDSKGDNKLFIELPKSFCEAGVSAVMLHSRILDKNPNTNVNHCDLMIVVLKGVPNGYKSEDLSLRPYPKTTIHYNADWRRKLILGRSSADFVKGRCVAVESSDQKIHYLFLPDAQEKGDSGTVLYADMGNGERELVGLYKGYKRVHGSKGSIGNRGVITPAIGWSTLDKLDALTGTEFSVKTRSEDVSASKVNDGSYKLNYGDAGIIYGTIIKVSKDANLAFTSSGNCDIGVSDDEDGYYDTE